MALLVTGTVIITPKQSFLVHAKQDNIPFTELELRDDFEENLAILEQGLVDKGIDVLTELNNQLNYYNSLLLTEISTEKINQIQSIIDNLQLLIYYYELIQDNPGWNQTTNNAEPPWWNPLKWNPVFLVAFAAVIAWYNHMGYYFAAELLGHAWVNNTLNSSYYPIHSWKVLHSTVYTDEIANHGFSYKWTYCDPGFENKGTTHQRDLYYAIKRFWYLKTCDSPGMVKIEIEDRYDFAYGFNVYDPITQAAVNTMKTAEVFGFLTPFFTRISHVVPGNSSLDNFTIYATVHGDFDGDGILDTAVIYGYGLTTLMTVSTATGTKIWWVDYDYNATRIVGRVFVGDFSGGGKDEIAVFYDYGNNHMRIHVFMYGETHYRTWLIDYAYDASRIVEIVAVTDYNGDGRADIIVRYYYWHINAVRTHAFISTGNSFYWIFI